MEKTKNKKTKNKKNENKKKKMKNEKRKKKRNRRFQFRTRPPSLTNHPSLNRNLIDYFLFLF